ncbi:MAG TPA: hypothetical protein PK098_03205 [Phycisphaerales bacterium]|nr:hypothetical protein [Phycisphaerales bacterium]
MKRTIPLFIAAVAGYVMVIAIFVPRLTDWREDAELWFNILAAVAFVLGGASILGMHLKRVSDRRAGWGYSLVTLGAFLTTLIVGLLKVGVPPSPDHPTVAWSGAYETEGGVFKWIFDNSILPITATMFAMLAFYVASAAFRAFRAKNLEAGLLLGTAFIILLGRSYAGTMLTGWYADAYPRLTLPGLTDIIMGVFNTAGQRAIMIGIALGVVATSLKILLGIDRSYLGGRGS